MTLATYYTRDDLRVFSGDVHQWMSNLPDPHEFVTAFVNWIEENTWAKGDLFPALQAIDHWEAFGSLEGL